MKNQINKHQRFIEKATKKHNGKYDYSKTNYTGSHNNVSVVCPIHGEFDIMATSHLSGRGCQECGKADWEQRRNSKARTVAEMIEKLKLIHGDEYDYSKVTSSKDKDDITIICKIHGEFTQRVNNHLHQKQKCPQCYGSLKKTTQQFIEEARKKHSSLSYDYSKVIYVNDKTKVEVICPTHGSFWVTPNKHLRSNNRCPTCFKLPKTSTEEFIRRSKIIHLDKYDYSQTVYKNIHSNVTIICPEHGPFNQLARKHIEGCGCKQCTSIVSLKEQHWLKKLGIPNDPEHRQVSIKCNSKNYKVDGFDPLTNTVYEFLGDFWHGNPDVFNHEEINPTTKTTFRDLFDKTFERFKELENDGYTIVYIWENQFKIDVEGLT